MTNVGLPEVPKGYTWRVYTQALPSGVGFIVALIEPGDSAVGAEEFGMDAAQASRNDAQQGIYEAAQRIAESFYAGDEPDGHERLMLNMIDLLNLAGDYPPKTFIKAL